MAQAWKHVAAAAARACAAAAVFAAAAAGQARQQRLPLEPARKSCARCNRWRQRVREQRAEAALEGLPVGV